MDRYWENILNNISAGQPMHFNTGSGVIDAYLVNDTRVYMLRTQENQAGIPLTEDNARETILQALRKEMEQREQAVAISNDAKSAVRAIEDNAATKNAWIRNTATSTAKETTKFMENNINAGEYTQKMIGDDFYYVSRDTDSYLRYFHSQQGAPYEEISRPEFTDRMTESAAKEYRQNNLIDADMVVATNEGVLKCNQNKDGTYSYSFKDNDNNERTISKEEVETIAEKSGLREDNIRGNTSEARARKSQREERAAERGSVAAAVGGAFAVAHAGKDALTRTEGSRSGISIDTTLVDQVSRGREGYIDELSKSDKATELALQQALQYADNTNTYCNGRVNQSVSQQLREAETNCKPGESVDITHDSKVFTVSRDKEGNLSYSMTSPEPKQDMNRKDFSDALFVGTKRDFYKDMQDKKMELAIVPINEKTMLVIRPQDIGSKEENAFIDGNDKFNYFIREGNKETQIKEEDVKTIFKDNNITDKNIGERLSHTFEEAKEKAKRLANFTAKTAVRALEQELIGQLKKGLSLGEEMSRMV